MKLRLQWETASAQGGVPLRARVQYLAWTGEGLDPVTRLGPEQPGLSVHPPDAEGRVLVEGRDGLVLDAGGRTARRARLRPGSGIAFQTPEASGRLRLEGEAPGTDPLLGQTLGGYRIRELLGRGAVGAVYRALQETLDRDVALKVLAPELARDPMKVASFRREAVAAGRLVHPNLVQVYDVGEEEGYYFYSMELVPGGSLEDRLRADGPLPWREAVAAIRDGARALAYAEEHHLVHRDVKPANLMLGAGGHVKLADLGLAATRDLVTREAAGGTPHFMAPENLGGGEVDHRADLYSLGCTLYRLVTGETPFQGETVRDILRAHRDTPPPTFRDAGVHVPRELEDLLAALLAKDPEQRPAHALEVVEACEHCLQARRRRRLAPLLAVIFLGAALAGWRSLRHQQAPPPPAANSTTDELAAAERARLEARLQQERVARLFAEALAIQEPAARARALESFLVEHPGSLQADEARSALEQARTAASQPEATVATGPEASGAAEAALTRQLEERLAAGKPGAALALLERSPLPAGAMSSLRERVQDAARELLAAATGRHARALASGDLDEAARIRRELTAALSGAATLPPPWSEALQHLEEAEDSTRRAQAVAAFAGERRALAGRLARTVQPALLALDPARALAAWQAAAAELQHAGLRQAMAAEEPLLTAAARAGTALRERLAGAGRTGIPVVDPQSGKKAQLLEVGAEGLLLEVLVRGERVRQEVPWAAWRQPEPLAGLLRAVLPQTGTSADACALYLAAAEAALAGRLRAWGAAPPDPDAAAALAAEAQAWLRHLPRPPGEEPSWLPRHRRALATAGRLGAALAAGREYLAWQHLRDLLGSFGLLAALASDGRSTWGLAP